MKRRPVTRKSTCVDLNLPISNPAFACEKCEPFLDVTSQTRKNLKDVTCLQPWSIKRWGNHREVRIVQKCKKVREFLGLSVEDEDLIEEVTAKRSCTTNYNPIIVKLKFDWKRMKKDVNLSRNDNDDALQELDRVHKSIEKNILLYHNLSLDYQSSFGASPPPLPVSKQTINRFRTYFDIENREEGVSKEENRNKTIVLSPPYSIPKSHQQLIPAKPIFGIANSCSIPTSAESTSSAPKGSLIHVLQSCFPRKFIKAQSAEWILENSVEENTSGKRMLRKNVSDFNLMLKTISSNKLDAAHLIIKTYLEKENNQVLSERLASNNYSEIIVSALKEYVKSFLSENKKAQEKEALSALVTACTTFLPADVNKNKIREMLGFQKKTFYNYLQRETNTTTYQHLIRKGRTITDLQIQQRNCVFEFSHAGEASSIDSNSRRVIEVKRGEEYEKHVGRVWRVPTIQEQYNLFLQSETLTRYSTLYPDFKPPKKTRFYALRCPCVGRQSRQSCVDLRTSGMQQYMRAVSKFLRSNKEIREQLTTVDQAWTSLLGGYVEDFISAAQCAPVVHEALAVGVGSMRKIPKFVRWECAEGKCPTCKEKLRINECVVLNNCSEKIEVLEWKDAPRAGTKGNKQNTQLELGLSILPVNEVMKKLQSQLEICKLHQAEYRWRNHMRQIDLTMSNSDTTRVICTDFGATLDLSAVEKDNCSVDNHAVICIFFIVYNWRVTDFIDDGNLNQVIINDCDKWIWFGDTMSKGKKNDHIFHNACLEHIITFYDKERSEKNLPSIKINIVHTDNCPTQYKCRQNFWKVATHCNHHSGAILIHKFAQKYRFKGSWDATGKHVKYAILKNEMKFDRCHDAKACYYKLKRDMTRHGHEKEKIKWREWEQAKDKRIVGKTTFKTNRTFVGLAVESMDEVTHMRNAGEEHIVFTDRVNIPNTKVVPGTQMIYQVMGEKNVRNDGGFNLHTSQLQCSCKECRQDPTNIDSCLYKNKRREQATHILRENKGDQPEDDEFGILRMKLAELQLELRERGLRVSGNKETLRNRLITFLKRVGDETIDENEDEPIHMNEGNEENNTRK